MSLNRRTVLVGLSIVSASISTPVFGADNDILHAAFSRAVASCLNDREHREDLYKWMEQQPRTNGQEDYAPRISGKPDPTRNTGLLPALDRIGTSKGPLVLDRYLAKLASACEAERQSGPNVSSETNR